METLPELVIRYAIFHPTLSTVETGVSKLGHREGAARPVENGPLPPEALAQISDIQSSFAGKQKIGGPFNLSPYFALSEHLG